jgi:hypothetical protein
VAAIGNNLSSVETNVAAIQNVQGLQWDAKRLEQHKVVLQWLSPTEFAGQQHDIISRREEGTGQWFLDSPEFDAWQQGGDKTLFCPGIPGAGKTMVAAIAVDHLCKRAREKNENIGISYLFCNYKAQLEQSAANFLAVVLKQLVQSQPDLATLVIRMHGKHEKQKSRPSLDEILGAIQSACAAYSTIYLVVDALDECSNQDGTRIQFISKLREVQAKTNMHLIVTSRFIPDVVEQFESGPTLEVRASDHDVRRYVAGQLLRLPRCVQRNDGLARDIQNKIAEAVDGMYVLLLY